MVVEADSIKELADKLDINEKTLTSTIDDWNKAVSAKKDEDFELLKSHFGITDDELCDKFPLDLLWDACKECGENI